ncbi:MAG TPA: chemotaxis protein CheW [Anaeromyxobacteraceae bacterium]|nr:chemotaxis protein CheW [Anaeromyxobacteraceae bacterium]
MPEPPPGPAQADPIVQLCTFRVAGEDYAVDIMRVREIIPPRPVTRVPRAVAFVEGVVRLRGEVVPVVDLRRRLGFPPEPPTRKTKLVLVRVGPSTLALVVDEVCEVLRVPRSEIRAAPPLPGSGPRFVLGVCGGDRAPPQRRGGPARLRLLLDVRTLLEAPRPGEADAVRAQLEASGRS